MKLKAVSGMMMTLLVVSILPLLFALGFVRLQVVYASPYTSIDVGTAYNMITSGLYPDLVVLDVRTQGEYDGGHVYGAVWIPVSELEARIGELAGHENHEVIVYCRSGGRSVTASGILDSHNFTKVYNMLGGILAWQSAGHPVWIATVHNLNTTFNYDTIQAAIDAPQTIDGHTILVDAGTYHENVVVNKPVSLIGEDRNTSIIAGYGSFSAAVRVTTNGVAINGFTIRNSHYGIIMHQCANVIIQNNNLTNNDYCISLGQSSHNTVSGNNITNNNSTGIMLSESSINSIHRNNVKNNDYNGISLYGSLNNTISGNNITANKYRGIGLYGSSNNTLHGNNITNEISGITLAVYSNNNTIYGNNISDNEWGISDSGTSENKIYHNNFINNTQGVHFDESSNNYLYHNNFINNTVQVLSTQSINVWDDNYPSGGNYWSDYTGVDANGDGIGDTPYAVNAENQDRYPLMNPWGSQPPIANFAYSPEHPGINGTVSFNASASYDRDGFIASYVWDFGDGNITIVADPIITHLYTAPSTYTVNLTVIDNDGFTHSVIKSITIEKISSTITVNVDPTIATVGLNVTINGTITPIRIDANVTISYRLSGETWSTLATVKTDSSSHYTYTWKTTNEGIYEIKASWQGDENTLPGESETKTVIVDSTPPITLHDYDGLWHTTDFTITLTATDNLSDVAETYYKINDGPTKTVSADGQPQITTESANNTLEYWSVDNAGNEEHPHNILTGIKLDKTVPIIGIPSRIPEGYVQPNQIVKVSVNVTDLTSDVKSVRLAYFINNSTIGIEFPMTFNSTTGLYVTSFGIPGQQANTLVRYAIAAYDNAGNHIIDDNIGQYYVYTVIPEFPTWTPILLTLIILAVVIAIYKRRILKTPIH